MTVGTRVLVVVFLLVNICFITIPKQADANISDGWVSSLNYNYSWDNFLIGSISLYRQFPYRLYVDSYLRKYHESKWLRFRQDEFMWGKIQEEAVDEMKRKVKDFRLNHNFSIFGVFRFGDYNFETEEFFFEPFSENMFIGIEDKKPFGFPSEFKIKFENYDAISGIKLSSDDAKDLIATRPLVNGKIQRHLYGELKFKLSRLQDRKLTFPYTVIIADVDSLTLYSDQTRTDLVASFILRSNNSDYGETKGESDHIKKFKSNNKSGFNSFRSDSF